MSPAPYYTEATVTLHLGDCLDVLPTLADASVDAVVCDPPYGLADHHPRVIAETLAAWLTGDRASVPDGKGFMGRAWDRFVPPPAAWDECLRVLKPGGHLVAFAAPRTVDLMTLSIRLAGFEIRDSLHWIYGNGFPKSLDVSKSISGKELYGNGNSNGIRRARLGEGYEPSGRAGNRDGLGGEGAKGIRLGDDPTRKHPTQITQAAARWEGFGTGLKPAHEPIILARRPLEGTVAGNVLTHGTGALNIGACRVDSTVETWPASRSYGTKAKRFNSYAEQEVSTQSTGEAHPGRWPSNAILTHPPLVDEHGQPVSDACADGCVPRCPVAEMDQQSGVTVSVASRRGERRGERRGTVYNGPTSPDSVRGHDDEGGASRFFPVFRYEAKAPASERPRLAARKVVRLRADLTKEQRAYVLAELTKAGVDVS